MSSIQNQFLDVKAHHARYPAIDPKTALKRSASSKIIFITGASQGIGQATAVAFAQAGAKAIYVTARSEKALGETKAGASAAFYKDERPRVCPGRPFVCLLLIDVSLNISPGNKRQWDVQDHGASGCVVDHEARLVNASARFAIINQFERNAVTSHSVI